MEPDEDSQHQDIQLGGTLPVHLLVLFVLEHDDLVARQQSSSTGQQEATIPVPL